MSETKPSKTTEPADDDGSKGAPKSAVFVVTSPIFFKGERHEIDAEVKLTPEQAASLPGYAIKPKQAAAPAKA